MNLVCTIRNRNGENEYQNNLLLLKNCGITCLRFNLGKYYGQSGVEKLCYEIMQAKMIIKNLAVILDMPYPGYKERLVCLKNHIFIQENEIIYLKTEKYIEERLLNTIYVHSKEIDVSKGNIIYYDNGEGAFEVIEVISKENVRMRALASFELFDNKSLFWGQIKKEKYIKWIDRVCSIFVPEYMTFSFIESKEDLHDAIIGKEKYGYKIISKIETNVSLKEIENILDNSDGIMLGRGDYCLTSDIETLLKKELFLKKICEDKGKEFYLATGFMSSLNHQYLPSRSDIVDISLAIYLNPTGIILNGDVLRYKTLPRVTDTVNKICEDVAKYSGSVQ